MIEKLRMSVILANSIGETTQAADWLATAENMALAFNEIYVVKTSPVHVPDIITYDEATHTWVPQGASQAVL